ncbi:choice-of-anchor B family protein [Mesoflavibacter zeaxanthinifaciens]|uniref:choice-of-anchor B family protein n=1 Tax=Mesoflavibacter zeaxanthinifaciens TaxID=393060 RepID=UPI003A8E16DF
MNNFKLKIKHYYKTLSLIVILLLNLSCSEDEELTSTQPNNNTQSSQSPCIDGLAGNYPCNGFDLMGEIDVLTLSGSTAARGNDIWGWTDPSTQKEYAIAALTNSTAFIDVTDATNPIFLGRLETNTTSSIWRDVKTYNNYAFIVADNAGTHGMQVFDLTRLRNLTSTPVTFTADTTFNGVDSCHNIVINEEEGVAYLVGCTNNNGGPIFVDITDPLNPTYLGEYNSAGYSHDAQVVTYNGPDSDYTGHQIYIGSNGNTDQVVILDVTDKSNITQISSISYPQTAYAHQGWFTEDQAYFILGDEVDEITYGFNTKTLVFDFNDLDNPSLSSTYFGPTPAIDHNGYVKGNEYYLANYRAGLRVLDISNVSAASNALVETGFFDTYPADDNPDFNGAWSVYPYFESENIIIGDIDAGLLIVRKSN